MRRLYTYLRGFYGHHELVRPPTYHYGKTKTTLHHEFVGFLDYNFYTAPMKNPNWEFFDFPSQCVG